MKTKASGGLCREKGIRSEQSIRRLRTQASCEKPQVQKAGREEKRGPKKTKRLTNGETPAGVL